MGNSASLNVSQDDLIPYLKKYGDHCMAYSTLQAGLEYFYKEGIGYIPYQSFWHPVLAMTGRKIVLSDPIADKKNYRELLEAFLQVHKKVIFIQIRDDTAQLLHDMGYQVNQFGLETHLTVNDFSLRGKARSQIRQWRNKCEREQVDVVEAQGNDLPWDEIKVLSQEWLEKKGGNELGFLTRPMVFEVEDDVRYFLAYQNDKLIAYAVFDPIYSDGEVVGYYHNVDRMQEAAPNGTSVYIILRAMDVFRQEGKQCISLGMSPLYKIREQYNHHPFTTKAFKYTFKKLNFLYPFQGNARHKKKFVGQTNKVYISGTKGMHLGEIFIMLKALKFF